MPGPCPRYAHPPHQKLYKKDIDLKKPLPRFFRREVRRPTQDGLAYERPIQMCSVQDMYAYTKPHPFGPRQDGPPWGRLPAMELTPIDRVKKDSILTCRATADCTGSSTKCDPYHLTSYQCDYERRIRLGKDSRKNLGIRQKMRQAAEEEVVLRVHQETDRMGKINNEKAYYKYLSSETKPVTQVPLNAFMVLGSSDDSKYQENQKWAELEKERHHKMADVVKNFAKKPFTKQVHNKLAHWSFQRQKICEKQLGRMSEDYHMRLRSPCEIHCNSLHPPQIAVDHSKDKHGDANKTSTKVHEIGVFDNHRRRKFPHELPRDPHLPVPYNSDHIYPEPLGYRPTMQHLRKKTRFATPSRVRHTVTFLEELYPEFISQRHT